MRKWISFFLAVFLLFLPSTAQAQASIRFSSMEVDLWPEYDSPSMLVIYRITLSPSVNLPVSLSLRIPRSAGKPSAVAARQIDGTLINTPYEPTQGTDWTTIKFTATMPEIQIEYYDPSLVQEGTSRHYEYTWPGDYEVESLTIQVQRPFDATNMNITPSLGSGSSGKDGLFYYVAPVGSGPIKAGQEFKLTLNYQKPTSVLSEEKLPVKPSAPIADNTPFFSRFSSIILWLLGGLGITLILVALGLLAYWFVSRNGEDVREVPRRRSRREGAFAEEPVENSQRYPEAEASTLDEGEVIYCSSCGKRASTSDRFCRSCGARLQAE